VSGDNSRQAAFWEDRAASWLATEHDLARVLGVFGPMALAGLDLRAGQRVIDIGCGSGATTIELAGRVGTEGEAVGVDIAPAMIAVAVDRAGAAGVENARFAVADAQVEDLGSASFDAAFSRFGVMFFADPVTAFANIHGALRPDGHLAFVCWQDISANGWMHVPGAAVLAVTGELPPAPGPGEPGPFSLAAPGRIEDLLGQAGFRQIMVTAHDDVVVVPEADIDVMVRIAASVGPVRAAILSADDETRGRLLAAVRAALVERVEHDEVRLSSGAFVVSARA
jgi:SAM-dependent methyltransferase